MDFGLRGKVALVTGSSRGIGRAIAEALAEAGAKVYSHGRNGQARETTGNGGRGEFLAADLASRADVDRLCRILEEKEDQLDILINNAGHEILAPLADLDPRDFDRQIEINLRAPVFLSRALLPLLKASSGASVVNVTSIHESTPAPANGPYCMAKAGLAMFTKVAALEWGPLGIRVNNLAPGVIETDMNREVIEAIGSENFATWIPAGYVAAASMIVSAALFLSSDASAYVTGTTLRADGAYSLNLLRYRVDDNAGTIRLEDRHP
jgi:NAD(P)-dependent dehydrogenase (short-subunit alcohol dehydrogenase family)